MTKNDPTANLTIDEHIDREQTEPDIDAETPAPADEGYPRHDGDTIVYGPGVFSDSDGHVVNVNGVNYVPQEPEVETPDESISPEHQHRIADDIGVALVVLLQVLDQLLPEGDEKVAAFAAVEDIRAHANLAIFGAED